MSTKVTVVLGMGYKEYLNMAISTIFRPIEQLGFWNNKLGIIIKRLRYDVTNNRIRWQYEPDPDFRYTPFAMMGIMKWRKSIGSKKYDEKIISALNYLEKSVKREIEKYPSYGIGPLIYTFSKAYQVFNDEKYLDMAYNLYSHSKEKFKFEHSEDSLVLYGWTELFEATEDPRLSEDASKAINKIIEMHDETLFIFKNSTTRRHQNQMYTLWGVSKTIKILELYKYLKYVERVLDYTVNKRMLPNGAFIWEDVPFIQKIKLLPLLKLKGEIPYWHLLFECHQTFFVNAVFEYYNAGGEKDYNKEIERAMKWIYGNNVLKKDLVELSGIGVPLRVMTINGNININGQMFKGSYEIGSYIMALTNLRKILH